jgi:hypothetical protein
MAPKKTPATPPGIAIAGIPQSPRIGSPTIAYVSPITGQPSATDTPAHAALPAAPGAAGTSTAGTAPTAQAGAAAGNAFTGAGTNPIPTNAADAGAEIAANLTAAGMPLATAQSIGAWALGQYAAGNSINQITQQVYTTQAFKDATPGFAERVQNGYPGMTVSQYFDYKTTVEAQAKAAGFPVGFLGNQEVGALVANNVSADEVSTRINDAFATSMNAPPQITKALQDYYHVGPGGVAAYFLDPTKATDVLHQQATAAIIGGESAIAGFGEISAADALRFAKASGLTGGTAAATTAAAQGQLGAVSGEVPITESELGVSKSSEAARSATAGQVVGAALLGDYADKSAVQRAVGARTAAFQGGGGAVQQGAPGQPNGVGFGTQ